MNDRTVISNAKSYTFKTPDNETLNVSLIDRKTADSILKQSDFIYAEEMFQIKNGHDIYFSKKNSLFMEVSPDRSAYIFFQEDYTKYQKGINYWKTSIIKDGDSLFICFRLRPAKVINFIKIKIKILDEYRPFENFKAYLLPENAILYARERVNNLYDGTWFPTLKDFEWDYKNFSY